MNIKDAQTQLALALLLRILLTSNNTINAVVSQRQYSSYQPLSYYSQSLSGYGNENQNHFDNPSDGYSSEPNQRQQFAPTSYGASGGGFVGGDEQHSYQQDSYQPQTSYQDYLNEHFVQFRQEQESALDSFGRHYHPTRPSDDTARPSFPVSFDNIDFNNSETMNYRAAEDVIYPPLDAGIHHQHQQQTTRQQYPQSVGYNNMSPSTQSRANSQQSVPYLSGDGTPNDNAVFSNADAYMMVTMSGPPTPPRATQMNAHHEMNAKPYEYIENDNQQDQQHMLRTSHHQPQPPFQLINNDSASSDNAVAQMTVTMSRPPTPPKTTQTHIHGNQQQHHQDQRHIPTTNQQSPRHFESSTNERLSSSSPLRTYYVADSDLTASSSNLPPGAQPLSQLHSHFVQLPSVPSPPTPIPPTFAIPGEPIPISKHVEITRHVPIPVYKQIHVPFRKPVRIEIPRPVISTYPRPYPIQIPTVTKTVAVPLVKEVKIPIEKVTPYPVEHKVPYVVEKRVPFQVEKQVAAPIYYPFPVKVPMVRTILHKKRAHLPSPHYRQRIHM